MGWWLEQVVPRVAHACLDVAEVRELRPPVCEGLAGDVARTIEPHCEELT